MIERIKQEYDAPMVSVTEVSVEDGFRLSHMGETPVADPAGYGMTECETGSNEFHGGTDFH